MTMTPSQIRQLRRRLRLSQRELAARLLVSRETISRWERRSRTQEPSPVYINLMRQLAGIAAAQRSGIAREAV